MRFQDAKKQTRRKATWHTHGATLWRASAFDVAFSEVAAGRGCTEAAGAPPVDDSIGQRLSTDLHAGEPVEHIEVAPPFPNKQKKVTQRKRGEKNAAGGIENEKGV